MIHPAHEFTRFLEIGLAIYVNPGRFCTSMCAAHLLEVLFNGGTSDERHGAGGHGVGGVEDAGLASCGHQVVQLADLQARAVPRAEHPNI